MGLAAGINQYAYVNNSPTDLTDPSGLLPTINLANSSSYNSNPNQAFLAGSQNLGRVASSENAGRRVVEGYFVDEDGTRIVDKIPGTLPSVPGIPRTSLDNLKSDVVDLGLTLLDGLQAISPAEGALIGIVGALKGLSAESKGVTYLYQKLGAGGEHLKYGITNNQQHVIRKRNSLAVV